MNERGYLAERFEENRTHLRAVAYRMLGSLSEVDDAVQEAWLRLSRADTTGIEGRFDYFLVESTGLSERLLVTESRLGLRTVLTFPLLPPPQKN